MTPEEYTTLQTLLTKFRQEKDSEIDAEMERVKANFELVNKIYVKGQENLEYIDFIQRWILHTVIKNEHDSKTKPIPRVETK